MKPLGIFALTILSLAGCSKTATAPATGPAATVVLKDGSTFAGNVTKSDTSAITVQSASGESRTYPMTQVASVQYGSQSAPLASQQQSQQPAPAQPQPFEQPGPYEAAPSGAVNRAPMPAPRPVAEFRTIPAGTTLAVRNNEAIQSDSAATGRTYSAVVARDVVDSEGRVAIPHGSNATLVVRAVSDQGRVEGRSELVLDVASVAIGGRNYRLETNDIVERGTEGVGKNKRTGEFIGGGTALGGIIGAIAGGGKGAAIGALSGAAAGTATQTLTRGKAVHVPSETVLSFRLEAPVRIRELR